MGFSVNYISLIDSYCNRNDETREFSQQHHWPSNTHIARLLGLLSKPPATRDQMVPQYRFPSFRGGPQFDQIGRDWEHLSKTTYFSKTIYTPRGGAVIQDRGYTNFFGGAIHLRGNAAFSFFSQFGRSRSAQLCEGSGLRISAIEVITS